MRKMIAEELAWMPGIVVEVEREDIVEGRRVITFTVTNVMMLCLDYTTGGLESRIKQEIKGAEVKIEESKECTEERRKIIRVVV